MSKPDWSKPVTHHGGKLKDIPEPHVRRWPNKHGVKRRVEVNITSFVGIVGGARHFTPHVEVENNAIWNGEAWQNAWDDREGYGTRIDGPAFTSEKKAREWIQWTLRAFDPKTHEFVWTKAGLEGKTPPKWFYPREGD